MRTRKELFKGFIHTLEKQDGITYEFDAGIWSSLVQEVIVKSKDDIRFIFKNGFEVRVQKWDLWHSGGNAWVPFCQENNSYYDRIFCCMSESKGSLKFEFAGEIIMTFGERLYELRKNKNISQEELAELLDVSRQSISKWENDKAYPEMTRLLFMSEQGNIQSTL